MSSFHQHIQWETSTLVKRSNSDELYPLSSESNTTRSTTPDAKNGEKAPNDFLIDKDQDFETWSNRNDLGNGNALNNIDFNESNQFEIDVCPKKKKFDSVEERRMFVEEYKRKFKTEMCKNWELKGCCRFGDRCCFAHGKHELKEKVLTHTKYKTKPCKQYHQNGYCPYGQRCQYLHKEAIMPNIFVDTNQIPVRENVYTYDMLFEVNRLCGTDCELKIVLDKLPKRKRLNIFDNTKKQF